MLLTLKCTKLFKLLEINLISRKSIARRIPVKRAAQFDSEH